MASKRPTDSKSKELRERENYQNYVQASLEVEIIDWEEADDTPPCDFIDDKNDATKKSKQRKLGSSDEKDVRAVVVSVPSKVFNQKRNLFDDDECYTDASRTSALDPFAFLIDEIILNILSYLPRSGLIKCAQVCRRWRKLGYDKVLWRHVNLDSKKFTEEGVLGLLLHHGVKTLRLSKAEILAPIFSDSFTERSLLCNESNNDEEEGDVEEDTLPLMHLDCSMSKFADNTLSDLLYKCTQLKNLSLEGCKVDQSVINAVTLNRDMEVLNLALTVGLRLSSIDILTRQCKKLTSINLSWSNQTRDTIRYICRCKNMKSLNLSGLRGGINRISMEMLVKNCKKLTELDLSDVTLQIGSLKLIADELTALEKLSISRCTDVRSEQLLDLQNLKSLSHLNLFGFLNSAAMNQFSECRPDIHINKNHFSPIARPIVATSYEGKLWEQYVGFII